MIYAREVRKKREGFVISLSSLICLTNNFAKKNLATNDH